MKTLSIRFWSILLVAAVLSTQTAIGQSGVLNPNDPIVVYNPSSPPATPPANTLAKWVKTNRLSWNSTSFKCYYYNGIAFRLKFPKSYVEGNGVKYPLYVFFHGIGERGSIYDNEFQLFHGGQTHMNAVNNDKFDGFLLYPQTSSASGGWSAGQIDVIANLIKNHLIPQAQVDPFRISINGLSGGGGATWMFLTRHTALTAADLPMSGTAIQHVNDVINVIYNPIWIVNGGLDDAPSPYTVDQIINQGTNLGANMRHTFYPDLGHGVWNRFWGEADYFPYMLRAHKANPWVRYGRTEFCIGDIINVTIGVTAGFDGYEWKKDGGIINGASSNTIQATDTGTYECRVLRGAEWSVWSPIPARIKHKTATVSPDIQVAGLASNVLPSLDGKTTVDLQVPAGYTSYVWQRLNPVTTLPNTGNTVPAATVGSYQVKVTEQYGCSSNFSNVFNVVDANGPDAPPAPANLSAIALSQTKIRLNWTLDNSPAFVETKFEVYQSATAVGPFKLIGFAPARTDSFVISDLSPNVRYYYIVRAVNNTAASAETTPASALTFSDNVAPTPPGNLRTANVNQSSVSLLWDASTDISGIDQYDVYVNGHIAYTIPGDKTAFTVYNLVNGQHYNFVVKARDIAGNVSSPSNQVVAAAAFNGLNYKHYTFTGTWNSLPDFNTLIPVATGNVPNVSIVGRVQNNNFAYLWEGFIQVPVSGTYYFRTASDDGSKLYLGTANSSSSPYSYSATAIVNNDGLHGTTTVTSDGINLTAGLSYPIAISFYEQGGGEAMSISWRTPQTGTSYIAIPNSAFIQSVPAPGNLPASPSALTATTVSAKKIVLGWIDNSSDETGFEIYRSLTPADGYSIVSTVGANVTSYSDSTLDPSTTYYYRLRSINANGGSDYIPAGEYQARWKFENNYNDNSGNGRSLTPNNSPTFSTDEKEGTYSVDLNGSNEDITVNTSSGDYLRGGYSAKTVAFWMRSDVTNSNRGIFDFGGSDNGLSMRINSNSLIVGVANNNTRRSISTPFSSTEWTHVAIVYNANSLLLYVNGAEVASNTNLGFYSVGVTTNGSMIGDDNGSNSLNTSFGQFDGRFDDFVVLENAADAATVISLMNNSYGTVYATTMSLPVLPAAPTDITGVAAGPTKIDLSWTNNAAVVSRFELWRSPATNANYELAALLYSDAITYTDSLLAPNTVYYYKLRAVNEAGASDYSNEINVATTANPVTIVTLSAIPTQNITNDDVVAVNLIASSDLGTSVTYSATGLPSFAAITSNADNSGTITLTPKSMDLGSYSVTVTATDNYGGTDSKAFTINVSGKNQVTINLNFNQSSPQAAPWNNTNSAPVANLTVNALKDANNNITSVGFNMITAMTGSYSNAVTTGNNSGVFPDNVMRTMYFSSTNAPVQFRLTGLSATKKYSLIIHAGYPWTPQQEATSGTLVGTYSVGAQTVTLNAANNTSNTVRINGISPDGSGNVVVTMAKAPGAGYVIINAMQILSYDDEQAAVTFNPPFNVKAVGTASDKINISWQNPTETRTAVELWRSTSPNGIYSLRATLGANAVTYSDNGLATGATFFYKLRSVNNTVYSAFTEPVGASTISYVIKLNLNSQPTLSQSPPWNNLNTLTFNGYTFENMMNMQQQSTGVNFHVVNNFTSFHDGVGITTGNNSGVVPDNVMKTLYYVAAGDIANFQITGLNRTHIYNIEFFAGSTFNYPSVSQYQIGDEIVQLNGLNNTTQTVSINNLKPDSTGAITVKFFTTSMYAFLNALMIHGMPSPEIVALDSASINNILESGRSILVSASNNQTENAGVPVTSPVIAESRQAIANEAKPEVIGDIIVYPNPFRDKVTLKFDIKEDVSKFTVVLSDINGKQLSRTEFRNAKKGIWQQSLQLNNNLPAGMYILHIIGIPGEKPRSIKLLKTVNF